MYYVFIRCFVNVFHTWCNVDWCSGRRNKIKLDTDFCNKCGLDGGLCDGCVKKEIYLKGRADAFQEIAYSDVVIKEPFEELAYQKGRADAIDEMVKLTKPCNNCPSYPNECNDTDYFEDCCRTEQSISWEDLRKLAEQLKENK